MSTAIAAHDTDPAPAPRPNGGDHGPPCAVHEAAIVELRATMAEVRVTLAEIKVSQHRFEARATEEFLNVFGELGGINTRLDRLLEGVSIGHIVRAPLASINYDELSDTGIIRASQLVEEENKRLRTELLAAQTAAAAATARFDERVRHSDRVRADEVRASDMSVAKWKLIAGLVATALTSGGIAALLAQMLGGG